MASIDDLAGLQLVFRLSKDEIVATTTSCAASHTPETGFKLFSQLPQEIQDDIWKNTVNNLVEKPRIYSFTVKIRQTKDFEWYMVPVPTPEVVNLTRRFRATVQACRNARDVLERQLPNAFKINGNGLFRFIADQDVMFIECLDDNRRLLPNLPSLNHLPSLVPDPQDGRPGEPAFWEVIQRVAQPRSFGEVYFFHGFMCIEDIVGVLMFTALKRVYVYHKEVRLDPSTTRTDLWSAYAHQVANARKYHLDSVEKGREIAVRLEDLDGALYNAGHWFGHLKSFATPDQTDQIALIDLIIAWYDNIRIGLLVGDQSNDERVFALTRENATEVFSEMYEDMELEANRQADSVPLLCD
jgi:hypothetical protein